MRNEYIVIDENNSGRREAIFVCATQGSVCSLKQARKAIKEEIQERKDYDADYPGYTPKYTIYRLVKV